MSRIIVISGGPNNPPPPPPPNLLSSPNGTVITSNGVTYAIFKGEDSAANARDYCAGLVD